MILAGVAGVLAGATLAVVITIALTSGTGPSPMPSKGSPGPKTTAKAVVQTVKSKPQTPTLPPGFELDAPASQSNPPTARPESAPLSPEQVFEKASPAVVYLTVRDKDFKPIGLGSGFFVDAGGLIVTNYHVIKGAEFATARLSNGSTLFVDGVVATDPNGDLALLKVSGSGFPCLKNADPALPKIGSAVYAIGNPRGLENTFSGGMVSGHRVIKEGLKVIQVTTPISPGSSGGPLLNAGGEVIGVTTAYLTTGQNLNFAVPVSGVSALIRKQGKVRTLASAGGGRFDSAETDELDKAWAAMAKKDWATATRLLTALRKTQPDNPFVWYYLGYLHLVLGNHEIAIEQYKQVIALKPDYTEAYSFMGDTLRQLERYPEAIKAYKTAIAFKPDYAWAYRGMGFAYKSLKRYPEAIVALKKAVAIEPDCADAYYFMGEAYDELKRYAEAIEAYKKAIAIKPDDDLVYYLMALAYEKLKRYPEAIEAYKQVIAIEPDDAEAYSSMGDAYTELKRYPEAIEAYKKAIAIKPDYAEAYSSMGYILRQLERYPEAIEAYKKAIAIKPDYAWAYRGMGLAYASLKRYPEAIEAYKKVVAIEPDNAAVYHCMARAFIALKRYPEAIEAYKKAIALKPDDADAYCFMGHVYEQLKRYPEAIAAYEQFLRLEPTGELADSVRKKLPELRRLAGK